MCLLDTLIAKYRPTISKNRMVQDGTKLLGLLYLRNKLEPENDFSSSSLMDFTIYT
ncbi:hypothetical protein SAMN05444359_105193 [Neolewinella agarilytica]|uniref:Uncharacterized protein n=1 Tax=Neolewinella agarilytica TaxID=478744 RepID=A0A1H9DAR9_9BACT|nr:hypothetical protein SAMN05444359_105193 [Neolewinella agarilytica]